MNTTDSIFTKGNGSKRSDQASPCPPAIAGSRRFWPIGTALATLLAGSALAAPILVPNGGFSDSGNDGSIGGLLGTNIIHEAIGSGPWHGTSLGVAGLLALPTLSISSVSQTGTIGGLLGINLGGILNNGGYFQQELATTYQFGRLYILSATVNANDPLDLQLLSTANTGIGLVANGTMVASSVDADETFSDLTLIEGTSYRLRFGHVADIGSSGFISLRLFNQPEGLLTASLLDTISFSNVELEGRDVGPASHVVVDTFGDLLQAEVGQAFGTPLIAIVEDEDGDGVPGFMVRISAPLDGASADLSAPSSSDPPGRVITAMTDLDGIVEFYAEANEISGCYRVIVEALDPKLTVAQGVFHLRNWSNDPAQESIYCNGFQ